MGFCTAIQAGKGFMHALTQGWRIGMLESDKDGSRADHSLEQSREHCIDVAQNEITQR